MLDAFRDKYRISSARLENWDYSQNGYYFVTICTKSKKEFFGEIIKNKMHPSVMGKIVQTYWQQISHHFPFVVLDEFVIMPNHVHGILVIRNNKCRDGACPVSTKHKNTIGNIVGSFKSAVTKCTNNQKVLFSWQSRFYDHIIRDEKEFFRVREYIKSNPINWNNDRNNSEDAWI